MIVVWPLCYMLMCTLLYSCFGRLVMNGCVHHGRCSTAANASVDNRTAKGRDHHSRPHVQLWRMGRLGTMYGTV
jgi:hypothetical protein